MERRALFRGRRVRQSTGPPSSPFCAGGRAFPGVLPPMGRPSAVVSTAAAAVLASHRLSPNGRSKKLMVATLLNREFHRSRCHFRTQRGNTCSTCRCRRPARASIDCLPAIQHIMSHIARFCRTRWASTNSAKQAPPTRAQQIEAHVSKRADCRPTVRL